jgi:hypothetical protein
MITAKTRMNTMVVAFILMISEPSIAAGGLSKAKGIFDQFKAELLTIIPILAIIALVFFAIGYAAKFVEKEKFVRWAIGIIIVGSSAEITAIFLT